MPKRRSDKNTCSINEVASILGVSPCRVVTLIEAGEFEGVFVIPSSGRFGRARKIPRARVEKAIERWKFGATVHLTCDGSLEDDLGRCEHTS